MWFSLKQVLNSDGMIIGLYVYAIGYNWIDIYVVVYDLLHYTISNKIL